MRQNITNLARVLRKINLPKTIQPFIHGRILLLFRKIMLNGLRLKPFTNEGFVFPERYALPPYIFICICLPIRNFV